MEENGVLKGILPTLALVVMGASMAAAAVAQEFPSKPVRIISPFAPGGGADITARALASKLTPARSAGAGRQSRRRGGMVGVEMAVKALNMADVKTRLLDAGLIAVSSTPEAFASYIQSETKKWAKVIRDARITVE